MADEHPTDSHFMEKFIERTMSDVEKLKVRMLAMILSPTLGCDCPSMLDEIERLILKGFPVNSKDHEHPALHFACMKNDIAIAKLLIKHGADVNAKGVDDCTPLHEVFCRILDSDPEQMIKLLHKNGADVNALNFRGETPLHLAARSQFPSSAKTLMSLGADPFLLSGHEGLMSRPLGYSLISGNLQLMLVFLQQGDSFEDCGTSTLHYVYSRSMNLEIVKLLVEAGLQVPADFCQEEESRLRFLKWPDSCIEWLTGPRSLQIQCMRMIRKSVGKRNLERIGQLHLPTKLKDRLMFKFESLGVKNDSDYCVDKGEVKTRREANVGFNVYEHEMPCRCI